jgi:hypothetical protein
MMPYRWGIIAVILLLLLFSLLPHKLSNTYAGSVIALLLALESMQYWLQSTTRTLVRCVVISSLKSCIQPLV